jgi:peptide deformylase
MAVLPIRRWPDLCLSEVCAKIETVTDEIRTLAADMLETMYDAPGRGLAAPQVGRPLRMFVMDTGWKDGPRNATVMIDPHILWCSETDVTGTESCLSIPGVSAEVTRAAEVRMSWTTLDGTESEALLTGADAVCAQHELDHLAGVMVFDRVSDAERARMEADYAG